MGQANGRLNHSQSIEQNQINEKLFPEKFSALVITRLSYNRK
jgi:hypothetical protein